MAGFEVKIEIDDAALQHALTEAPAIAQEEIFDATLEASLLLEREVKERTPVGIGGGAGLRGSISARTPRVAGDRIEGVVGTALIYAAPVEIGTQPHFPPLAPIRLWVETKLGVPESQSRSVAFLVARKIAREGTEGARMFADGFNATEPEVRRIYARANARIAERMAAP